MFGGACLIRWKDLIKITLVKMKRLTANVADDHYIEIVRQLSALSALSEVL